MTTQNTQNVFHAEKFQNAEQLWFWFLYSKSVQHGFVPSARHATRRVCELLDVEILITKLHYAGKLSAEQLAVMKEFGDRRRAPHQHIWAENRAAALWHDAMGTIGDAAQKCGWIE